MAKKIIKIIHGHSIYGGAYKQARRYAQRLADEGHTVMFGKTAKSLRKLKANK